VRPAWRRKGTVYVVGCDGLTLDVIAPMIREGDLPHLARIEREGCHGRLATISPTNSSVIWTSISTGCHYRDHGIDGFDYYQLFGKGITRSSLRTAKKLGLKGLAKALQRVGLMSSHLFSGRDVKRKRFWEILSDAGWRVGVVNWWHAWPAQPVNGFIVSDRLLHWRLTAKSNRPRPEKQLTFPPELLDEASKVAISPDEVPPDEIRRFANVTEAEAQEFLDSDFARHEVRSELRFVIALDLSCRRVFEHCLRAYPDLALAAVYFRGPDVAQHCAFQYAPWARHVPVSAEERRRFGQVVPETYRMADRFMGSVLARMRPEDTLFVVSDHGFGFRKERGKYTHLRGQPPGVLYAFGNEFLPGKQIADADIYDVAPTLLRICGFPPAREMPGSCLEDILTPEFRRERPPLEPIASYGAPRRSDEVLERSRDLDEKVTEQLRALGYFD
jgi:predicted AlkP superfamily phosphohydrolase/phosphomutase